MKIDIKIDIIAEKSEKIVSEKKIIKKKAKKRLSNKSE